MHSLGSCVCAAPPHCSGIVIPPTHIMWSNNSAPAKGADSSPTSSLSNTVCISDPDGQWPTVQVDTVKELSEFGEIARMDSSVFLVARCILVTYFDVRAAQRVILSSPDRCEPFPAAAHDCRIVQVKLAAFAEKVQNMEGGFGQFGEVANISASLGIAIVEYYDMRAAQMLLAASQGTATPFTQDMASPAASLGSFGASWLGAESGTVGADALGKMMTFETLAQMQKGLADSDKGKSERQVNRPVRTQVSTKEFSKYDIDLDKIQRGEDRRTTVMVRNLSGQNARRDFLGFLDKCALGERFTFFYMPCKAHRNVPAGFAFVNFVAPSDVHKLFVMVKSGFWREFMSDPQTKAPGVSYARFQGHEELSKHFSSSAVLHEQDPDKRPIFKPEAAAKAAQENQKFEEQEKRGKPLLGAQKMPVTVPSLFGFPGGSAPRPFPAPSTGGSSTPPGLDMLANELGGYPGGLANLKGAGDLVGLLSQMKKEPAAADSSKDSPAYLQMPTSSPYGADQQQAIQLLMAAKSMLDSGYLNQQQMGA